MSQRIAIFALELLGPFRMLAPGGRRVDISSKKGQALIAMLATSAGGERTRSWLQNQLWGSRGQDQAQSSLRSELSNLRALLNTELTPLLNADHSRIWLDLNCVDIDLRNPAIHGNGEFLEGIDIAGENGFEDWLRDQRHRFEAETSGIPSRIPESEVVRRTAPSPISNHFAALPALAVLPFVNLTGQPGQDYLAEGMSEDLIDRLSRLRWLPQPNFSDAGQHVSARIVIIGDDGLLRHLPDSAYVFIGPTLCPQVPQSRPGRLDNSFG